MNCDYSISGLFPTPLYQTKINPEPSEKQKEFIDYEKTRLRKNSYNRSSVNSYILEDENMISIKKEIENHILNYLKVIYTPSSPVNLRITQSWLNISEKGESHHKHHHPNSFISGVYYLNANPEMGSIFFYRNPYYNIYRIESHLLGDFNSESWNVPIETGMLILFPSHLEHSVLENTTDEERVSLAFNTFLTGEIGSNETLTELIL